MMEYNEIDAPLTAMYQAGQKAFRDGEPKTANPYGRTDNAWLRELWFDGWTAEEQDTFDADEAKAHALEQKYVRIIDQGFDYLNRTVASGAQDNAAMAYRAMDAWRSGALGEPATGTIASHIAYWSEKQATASRMARELMGIE